MKKKEIVVFCCLLWCGIYRIRFHKCALCFTLINVDFMLHNLMTARAWHGFDRNIWRLRFPLRSFYCRQLTMGMASRDIFIGFSITCPLIERLIFRFMKISIVLDPLTTIVLHLQGFNWNHLIFCIILFPFGTFSKCIVLSK